MTRITSRTKLGFTACALGLGAMTVAACSSSPAGSASDKKVTLVVYSAQGYDHAMVQAFEKAAGRSNDPWLIRQRRASPLTA